MARMGLVCVVVFAGCSFGIRTSARRAGPTLTEEPTCSESRVRPGFDGSMAVWSAAAGLAAASHMNEYGCGNQDGYDSEYSCSTIYGIIGTSVAAAIAFTAAAVYGTKKAAACTKENDAYDEQMARVAVAHVAPPPTSPDWPPELVAACEQERALLVERAGSTTGIAKRLRGDMVCGPVAAPLPKQPARKRYKGRAADGVGAGMLVGPISLGLGAAIFAGNQ